MSKAEGTLQELSNAVLGETGSVFTLDSVRGFHDAALAMVSQARHKVQIFSPDLEAACYDYEDFVLALGRMANYHPVSTVQILVKDGSSAVKVGHRLVSLCQRFPSSVQARRIAGDYLGRREVYLLADTEGVIYRADQDSYRGYANFSEVDTANRLSRQFAEVWEHSCPEAEFRRLSV